MASIRKDWVEDIKMIIGSIGGTAQRQDSEKVKRLFFVKLMLLKLKALWTGFLWAFKNTLKAIFLGKKFESF